MSITARLDKIDTAIQESADAIADLVVKALGLPTAKERAEAAEEDRIATMIAAKLAEQTAPTREELWCELEGVNPALAGVFGSAASAEQTLIAKAAAAPSIESLRKGCEAEGISPLLAGIFGGA
jgi:hypothetical protein